MSDYPDTLLYIDGTWRGARDGETIPVVDPATEERIGTVSWARRHDLDAAPDAAARGLAVWRATSPTERSRLMRRAAELLRERVDRVADLMTREQGKPIVQARGETHLAAEVIEWFAEEGRRT